MQEKLNKLANDCIELGRYKAAFDRIGYDVHLNENETLGSKISALEKQINTTISEITLSTAS